MTHDEVIAFTRQWIEKAVIGLSLCPFARSVYLKDQVRFVVSDARHLDSLLEDPTRSTSDYRGKKAFLSAMLARPRIFFTDFFHERYEGQGRDNIQRLLELMESGQD